MSEDNPLDTDRLRSRRREFSRRSLLGGVGIAAVGSVALGGRVQATYDDDVAARIRGLATYQDRGPATGLRTLWRADTTAKVVALTFDDGPGDAFTGPLLDVLKAAGVPASFGVVGKRAGRRPDLVRRQVEEGHELFNHSWSHPDLSLIERNKVADELDRTNDLLHSLTGTVPLLVRPPYGRISGAVLEHVAESHQHLLLWHMRFAEEQFDAPGLARNVLDNLVPGMVILGHDYGIARRAIGLAAVPAIIRGAKEHGYTFVTATEMLKLDRASTGSD